MKAFLALMKIDLKLAFRNKSVLFFNYFFPLFFFFMFGQLFNAEQGTVIIQVVTMVTVIGILGNGLMGAGMRAVQEREANVLRRYKVTPITPVPLLASSLTTGLGLFLPGVILTLILATSVYHMKLPPNLASFFLFISIGCIAFRSIGLIVASVVNSSQESIVLIQPIYFAMLFLSGATIPIAVFPNWLQIITQFIPATYLMTGTAGILQRGESAFQNWAAILALIITAIVAMFIATKLFRWEKEETLRPSAKLWVAVALAPFVLLGVYQAWSKQDLRKSRILSRDLRRGRAILIQNARIFTGTGEVIESGAVLVRGGKVDTIYRGSAPDAKTLRAEGVDASGKTLLPGLIDVHVHLGSPGGFYDDWSKVDLKKSTEQELAAYIYSGVTAVRSVGDQTTDVLRARELFGSGEKLGAELIACGPLFTAVGGHGTEYAERMPAPARPAFNAEFVRTPGSPAEARQMVDDLAKRHVNCIKAILDAGVPARHFERLNLDILRAIGQAAHAHQLPLAVHTGAAKDVEDAVAAGANSIEHGSYIDQISDSTFAEMKRKGVVFDPTLSVVEGFRDFSQGNTSLLRNSLVQQVAPKELLEGTVHAATSSAMAPMRESIARYTMSLDIGGANLLRAWHAGVALATGSDAGNFLVIHGPTVQHEVELWATAGIPIPVALTAATHHAADLIGIGDRAGTIEKGKEATLIVVDGNPLLDAHALSSISMVMVKGERVDRSEVLHQD